MKTLPPPFRRGEGGFAALLLSPTALVLALVVVAPLAVTFGYTLFNVNLLSDHRGQFVGAANYGAVFLADWFWASLGRTLYFTSVSLVLETALGLAIAVLLNQKFHGAAFLRVLIILPWAIPTNVSAALWKWIYHPEYGVLNAVLSGLGLISNYQAWLSDPFVAMNMVIVADVWKMTPLAVIFFLAALQFVNKALYEAAKIDGAGPVRRFVTITLPFLTPTILVVVVMRTVEKFKAFDLFYVMTRGGPANGTKVLTYEAFLRGFTNLDFSMAATLAYVIAALILTLSFVYLRILRTQEGVRDE
jgi:multiple sugar transport system permease protein/N,N'-diacetylchitobiose transport system permease protein